MFRLFQQPSRTGMDAHRCWEETEKRCGVSERGGAGGGGGGGGGLCYLSRHQRLLSSFSSSTSRLTQAETLIKGEQFSGTGMKSKVEGRGDAHCSLMRCRCAIALRSCVGFAGGTGKSSSFSSLPPPPPLPPPLPPPPLPPPSHTPGVTVGNRRGRFLLDRTWSTLV